MLFEQCAQCQRCCRVDPGYPSLEISLTQKETQQLGSVCIDRSCQHLGSQGCTLDQRKPFSCQLYPLSYNPHQKSFMYDVECPIMPQYVRQLKAPQSEASIHLQAMKTEIDRLTQEDPDFLMNNYAIDVDYFELKKLPTARTDSRRGKS